MTEEKVRFGKPEGKEGEALMDQMDKHHTPVSLWAIEHMNIGEDDVILDIGCGSGLNIKRLHQKSPKAKTYGVDYSSTSVKKSKKLNNHLVQNGEIEVMEANVQNMPFEDDTFDVVTAFETVYFWPTIVESFKEVKRVLKPNGKFCAVLDANGIYAPEIEKVAREEGCNFYTDEELIELLKQAEYSRITVYNRKRKENKKLIKTVTAEGYDERLIDDNYDEGDIAEVEPVTPEWLCVISEK